MAKNGLLDSPEEDFQMKLSHLLYISESNNICILDVLIYI